MPVRKHERVSERRAEAVAFWQETNAETRELQRQALLDGIAASKEQYGYCPKCRGKVPIRFPDLRSINDSIQTLNRLAGDTPRPGEDGANSGGLVVKRIIVPPDSEGIIGDSLPHPDSEGIIGVSGPHPDSDRIIVPPGGEGVADGS